jgi:hypothetical protein
MRIKFLLTVAAASILCALAGAPLYAQAVSAPTTCNDGTNSTATGRGACLGHGGVQSAAASAPAPTAAAAPAGATAKCKDGTYSMAKHHQGACSKHGGVGEWIEAK